jgi:4'-phosphopantetheinyl transferase EntD
MTAGRAAEFSDFLLLSALASLAPAGIHLGCRTIRADDENLLLAEEVQAVTTRDPRARRASGAARHLARNLLARLGHWNTPIGRERAGQPVWPAGISGSIAHDNEVAVVAVASCAADVSLGLDVEPAEPLPDDILALVATGRDEIGTAHRQLAGRILFAAKEAAYKAAYPLDRVVLNHDDITVNLTSSLAWTRTGREVKLYCCQTPRIVVLASTQVWPPSGAVDRALAHFDCR